MGKNGNGNGNSRYTAEQMAAAIVDAGGFITRAAKALGCSPRTVYRYAEKYITVRHAIETAREERIDWAEDHLFKLIAKGNVAATIFYLKCQAKDRGYIERIQQEITGRDGGPIETQDVTDDRAQILSALCRIADRGSTPAVADEPDGPPGQEAPA